MLPPPLRCSQDGAAPLHTREYPRRHRRVGASAAASAAAAAGGGGQRRRRRGCSRGGCREGSGGAAAGSLPVSTPDTALPVDGGSGGGGAGSLPVANPDTALPVDAAATARPLPLVAVAAALEVGALAPGTVEDVNEGGAHPAATAQSPTLGRHHRRHPPHTPSRRPPRRDRPAAGRHRSYNAARRGGLQAGILRRHASGLERGDRGLGGGRGANGGGSAHPRPATRHIRWDTP
ncbi:hypothetical protein I4F81_011021 [Pyropia yezoensis]|uniref:Uncharacterized protein n=1 Tax=Pyropia yezoensis TaxID=2788 RepID=A0ACC3CF11_PYRYE|nr:hypothetical protein I4F81_011021 [Neopyropia yezoensis]